MTYLKTVSNYIDLAQCEGDDKTERLKNFLSQLVDETSESVHIERYFAEIIARRKAHIIIGSIDDETDHILYSATDVTAAKTIYDHLKRLGVEVDLISDFNALRNEKYICEDDLILVGGPFRNKFVKNLLDMAGDKVPHQFGKDDEMNTRSILDKSQDEEFTAMELSRTGYDGHDENLIDYALIAKYRNPWKTDREAHLFAGLNLVGTQAIADFLKEKSGYRRLLEKLDNRDGSAAVLRVTFTKLDPYDYGITSIELL